MVLSRRFATKYAHPALDQNCAEDRIERGAMRSALPPGLDRHFIEKTLLRVPTLVRNGAQNIDGGCGAEALVGTVSQHTQAASRVALVCRSPVRRR